MGDTDAAKEIVAELDPRAGQLSGDMCSIDHARALIALTLDDPIGAERLATSAIAASRRRRTPLYLARELLVLALVRSRIGGDGIDQLVAEALEIGERHNAGLVRNDAERYATRARRRLTRPRGQRSSRGRSGHEASSGPGVHGANPRLDGSQLVSSADVETPPSECHECRAHGSSRPRTNNG